MEAAAEFREHALTLAPETAGLRFDQALAQALPQYSRARLKTWIESGAVQVDGRPLRGKDRVLGGEQVRIHAQLPSQGRVQAEVMPLTVCTTVSKPRRPDHGPVWPKAESET